MSDNLLYSLKQFLLKLSQAEEKLEIERKNLYCKFPYIKLNEV